MRCHPAAAADQPHLYVLPHRVGGVIFVFVLLMVVFITNVPLAACGRCWSSSSRWRWW